MARGRSAVFLTQGPGSSVASIDEGRLASAHAFLVEGFKILCREIDLPANLHARGNEATEAVRDRRNRQNVRGDIFPNPSVSTSRSAHQHTIFVEQIHCKTVDLDLGEHVQITTTRVVSHSGFPTRKLFQRENIVQAGHLLEVFDRSKGLRSCTSYLSGRRICTAILRVLCLKVFEFAVELVVLCIRQNRSITVVVRRSSIINFLNELMVAVN